VNVPSGDKTSNNPTPPPQPSLSSADEVMVSVADRTVTEGQHQFDLIYFRLNKPADHPVKVFYTPKALNSGSGYATAGQDFMQRSSYIYFRPGTTLSIGIIHITDDNTPEPTETFQIELTKPQGAQIADGQAIITIKDND